jgi:hypothetical protein
MFFCGHLCRFHGSGRQAPPQRYLAVIYLFSYVYRFTYPYMEVDVEVAQFNVCFSPTIQVQENIFDLYFFPMPLCTSIV